MCLEYLDKIVNEIKSKYNLPINIIGSSFGGFVALLYINNYKNINKTFLKFPAVNFCECMERKLNIDEEYFIYNNYYELPSGFRIYKDAYKSFKRNNIMNNFNTDSDIYILHGDLDKTVSIQDIIYFTNNIKLKIVKGASHGMKDYLELINEEMINYFTK